MAGQAFSLHPVQTRGFTVEPVRLGLVGIGKIARDQHLPAIAADRRFRLAATASRQGRVEGIDGYHDIEDMIGASRLDAVSLCTPPDGRYAQALTALEAGLHVMLEKPPTVTLSHIAALTQAARAAGVTLFATWHSREAAGVAPARAWLADKRILAVRIDWREDIRRWHPDQEWILGSGGFGVFDPGINALSIATEILPHELLLEQASLDVPAGRMSPIAAELRMRCGDAAVHAIFDFLETGPQIWSIEVDTDAGTLRLAMGGSILQLPGEPESIAADREYARLYARFAELIAAGQSDVDIRPLRLVSDAFLIAERRITEAFAF
ncbi:MULTISPECIES: Gfo/Idh/MocA family protein [Sphingobium]|uniref:Gfo/Idh/MocA family oxidoreductase n=1 Tax=Sphingobium fuliginis ATCC 27551 TaxID=1208342 RepID=A0A5B8CJ66_SPHSA|nr:MULTISPECIES: Gfo/Idh/MocA family oxidoreductase [Sphingobium]QDC39528.1 Gfo/Idh/MocA family oxidoreductase [Sphingobium fuliginis ATCC 27551]